jgi:hypothetical protein
MTSWTTYGILEERVGCEYVFLASEEKNPPSFVKEDTLLLNKIALQMHSVLQFVDIDHGYLNCPPVNMLKLGKL